MPNRNTLHLKHLDAFAGYLTTRGFYPRPLTNCCERLRMRNGKRTVVLYQRDAAEQHLTVPDKDMPLVRAFLRARKEATSHE